MWPSWRNRFARLAELHRALLVLSTAGVAISASALANDNSNISAWALVAAFSALLFAADLLRATEDRAVLLSQTSGRSVKRAREDVFASSKPVPAISAVLAGSSTILAVAAGHWLL